MKIYQIIFASLLLLALFALPSCENGLFPPKGDQPTLAFCGQMNGYEERIKVDQVFVNNLDRIERLTDNYINRIKEDRNANFRTTLVTIPVVVHVVSKNATENISDAQIQSQIDALNNVFRLANADAATIPSPFNALATDVMIEFTLAQRDPNCNPTNGITRSTTTVPSFDNNPGLGSPQLRNPVKFTSSGGADGWPSDAYLNLWVCDLVGGLLGYAAFPADMATRPAEDGVVMDYTAFGTIGTASAPFNLGRVAAHETGHWLNLRHIWGDDCPGSNQCAGTDFVGDTPNQQCNNSGCPSFPKTDACTTSSPGVMFMNHMDYTSDACRRMFSIGQSDRMSATLYEVRNSLLGSQGALPPPATAIADLWMKDTDADVGNEPNNESAHFYLSDDIWVRNANDGLTNQESQNPIGGQPTHIYVRVRNRGCSTSSAATLRLYWAKASSGLGWTAPWDGTVTSPALMGDAVGSQSVGPINGNDFQIFHFTWTAPNPADYASFGADKTHFCLLARVETAATTPFGMTFPETGNLGNNVKNNNNIVWKNITITEVGGGGGFVSVIVANYERERMLTTLEFDFLTNARLNVNVDERGILKEGTFEVEFSEELFGLIKQAGDQNIIGLEYLDGTRYRIQDVKAKIVKIPLEPRKMHVANVYFKPNQDKNRNRKAILLNLLQINTKTNEVYGGQEFKFIID